MKNKSGRNTIGGTSGFTVNITDLTLAPAFVDDLLSDRERLHNISGVKIEIPYREEAENDAAEESETDADEQEDDDAESDAGSTASHSSETSREKRVRLYKARKERQNRTMSIICSPVICLLDAVGDAGGSLKEFYWRNDDGLDGSRPASFWEALYRHARTLEDLTLVYFTHETSDMLVPDVAFPALKRLHLDADSSHGCDGTAVNKLLSAATNIDTLTFRWPGCDLVTCQINGITWSYDFPKLKRLSLRGYDVDPNAYIAFLDRHTSVEELNDGVERYGDGPSDVEGPLPNPTSIHALPSTALPALTSLTTNGDADNRTVQAYLDPKADRPIVSLRISGYGQARILDDLAKLPSPSSSSSSRTVDLSRVKLLEVGGGITEWRLDRPTSSDDEKEHVANAEHEGLSFMVRALMAALPRFTGLERLRLNMDSSNTSVKLADGTYGHPPPLGEEDLRTITAILSRSLRSSSSSSSAKTAGAALHTLRLKDSLAEDVPPAALQGLKIPDNLKVLEWDAKAKVRYEVHAQNGRIESVERLRGIEQRRDGEWGVETQANSVVLLRG